MRDKPKKKRLKLKEGDVFTIPIDDNTQANCEYPR